MAFDPERIGKAALQAATASERVTNRDEAIALEIYNSLSSQAQEDLDVIARHRLGEQYTPEAGFAAVVALIVIPVLAAIGAWTTISEIFSTGKRTKKTEETVARIEKELRRLREQIESDQGSKN